MNRLTAARLMERTGTRSLLASLLRPRGVLAFNYHRVGDGAASNYDRELWSASAEAFDEQVTFMKRHADVISPDDLEHALRSPRGRYVMMTFDDGYRDNYELAFPILRRHGVPATFFISTGFIDQPALPWWDEIANLVRTSPAPEVRMEGWMPESLYFDNANAPQTINSLLRKYKALQADDAALFLGQLRHESGSPRAEVGENHWMDWNMVRDMSANGMVIGGHTVNHPLLSRIPKEQQRQEIGECAARIAQETGKRMEYFAYPVGGRDSFNEDTKACLLEYQVRYAFSYYGGFITEASQQFDMPRVAIEQDTDPDLFRAMVQLPQVFCRRPYH